MAEFAILDSGLRTAGDRLRYLWLRIATNGHQTYRCTALRELAYLPIETREDPDVLGKQWAAVRGLYNAGVDFVYSAAGMFTPERVGIVQYYGAAAEGTNEETAAAEALRRMAAVEAVIANYPQARLADTPLPRIEWLLDFLARRSGRNVLAILGHPDPRAAKRGMGRDGSLGEVDEDLASQQNEILFRGLARLKEDFVFLVTAGHVGRRRLADGLVRVAEVASNIASRRKGSIKIGFSLSLPLFTAIAGTHGGGYQEGRSEARGLSDGASHGWGRSQVEGQAHTESESEAQSVGRSWGHTVGRSEAESHGRAESHATSDVQGQSSAFSVSQGQSEELGGSVDLAPLDVGARGNYSHGWSESRSASQGAFESHAETHGVTESEAQTRGASESWSEGGFVSTTHGHGRADTVSRAEGIQESWGRAHGESQVQAATQGRGGFAGFGGGFTAGMIPGVSLGRSWQTEDDVADRLTEALRGLESLLNQATAEGGFMTEALLFTGSEQGAKAAAALAPQAFHGPNVPTPVLTVPGGDQAESLRLRALAFRPGDGGAAELPTGHTIAPGDVMLEEVPERLAPADALTEPAAAIGQALRVDRERGDVIRPGHLGQPVTLTADERAVAVRVTDSSGLAGLIRPGHWVGVMATIPVQGSAGSPGTFTKATIEPLRVLYLSPQFASADPQATPVVDRVTGLARGQEREQEGTVVLAVPTGLLGVIYDFSSRAAPNETRTVSALELLAGLDATDGARLSLYLVPEAARAFTSPGLFLPDLIITPAPTPTVTPTPLGFERTRQATTTATAGGTP